MAPGAAGRTASSAWAGRGQCGSGVSTVHAGLSVTLAELALSLPGDSRAPRRPALSPGQWHRPLHLPGPVLHPGDANCLRPPGSSGQLWQPVPLRTLRTVRETSYPRHGPAVVAPHSGACTPRALGSMEWGGPVIPRPGGVSSGHVWVSPWARRGPEGCWQSEGTEGHLCSPGDPGPVGVGCGLVRGWCMGRLGWGASQSGVDTRGQSEWGAGRSGWCTGPVGMGVGPVRRSP